MRKPENADDYIELIACAGDEGEAEFLYVLPALQEIEKGLKAVHDEIMRNEHTVGGGKDLPFMPIVPRERARMPVAPLIDTINLAYKKGFGSK